MPRPISWLPRLHEIARLVANSVRSHYGRHDLEQLFELQPRAAQKLLELFPTVQVGTSHLVEREVLSGFLERVRQAEDVPTVIEEARQAKTQMSRRKIRSLVRRDFEPANINSLPQSIALSRGRLEINFLSVELLAEDLFKIAQLLTEDVEEFASRFEPEKSPVGIEEGDEVRLMFAELEQLEAKR